MKLIYRSLSMLASVLGGLAASAVFRRIWKEVAAASALQGAVAGGVRAMVSRGSIRGFEKATGVWPGESAGVK